MSMTSRFETRTIFPLAFKNENQKRHSCMNLNFKMAKMLFLCRVVVEVCVCGGGVPFAPPPPLLNIILGELFFFFFFFLHCPNFLLT